MADLFPGQRSAIAKLAETARDPGQPSEQLSQLAREVFSSEATPAPVIDDDEPTLRRPARTTRADVVVPSERPPGVRFMVGAGVVGALVLVGIIGDAELSRDDPQPSATPTGPFALRVTDQRPVEPPRRFTLPVVNNAFPDNPDDPQDLLIADARDAIAGGNLKAAV